MNRPIEPIPPKKPSETQLTKAREYLYEGESAAEIMHILQWLIEENGIDLEKAEFTMYKGSQYDDPAPAIEYPVIMPNTSYQGEMKRYNKALKIYEQQMIKYTKANAVYQEYAKELITLDKKYKAKK